MTAAVRVHVVDDQQLLREGIATLLSVDAEVTVVGEAADGAQALDRVAEHRPDVVLMDLRMPRLDGIEATRRIVDRFPGVRVIVLTTFDDDAEVFEALRAGASGYLLKDCTAQELTRAIRLAADGGTPLHPAVASKVVAELNRLRPRHSDANLALAEPLTGRELEVLALVADGAANREIAATLHLAEGTVKNYVSSLLAKLAVPDRTRAALEARRRGLVR